MATTFEAIATVTVGSGGAANIEFTSIPQTYTDLCLLVSARSNESATWSQGELTFNSSSSSYSNKLLYGTGSGTGGATASTFIYGGRANGNSATANTFGSSYIYIPNYAGSNYKSVSVDEVTENNGTSALASINAGLWSNTAAITSIKIVQTSNSFLQYSTATLYGIKNS